MAKFTALELTQLLDRLKDHLTNDIFEPDLNIRLRTAEDIRLLREAAARCDEYANEPERWLQASDEEAK